MYPAVRSHHLEQAIHIGVFELGQLAVVQNAVDDGVLVPEGFQHIGIGRVAPLGLFAVGQAQFFKQHIAQLHRGVDVELSAGQLVDFLCPGGELGFQLLPIGGEAVGVQREADQLH